MDSGRYAEVREVILYGNTILSRMLIEDARTHPDVRFRAVAVDPEYRSGAFFCGLPEIDIANMKTEYPSSEYGLLAVLGGYRSIRSRAAFFDRAKETGYELINYISPLADVSPTCVMGSNNIIMALAHVGSGLRFGDNNLVRQQVYLGHEGAIGNHCVFGPGCRVGGSCHVADLSYVCMGSTVIDNLTLGEESLIGAGSVVIRNTEPHSKNVGNPSRIIGYHETSGMSMSPEHGHMDKV